MKSGPSPVPAEIRALGVEDASAYRALRLESLQAAPTAFLSSVEEEGARSEDWFRERVAPGKDLGVVLEAFLKGELVGITGLIRMNRPKTRHRAAIWGVY